MRVAHSGRARISARHPRAMGQCDRTGFWYSLDSMVRQFEWRGNVLADTGLLVGPDQVDVPQQQYRSLILPPDPVPRVNPRQSPEVTGQPATGQPLNTSPLNRGFTVYTLGTAAYAGGYPTVRSDVLAAVAANSGVPTPGFLVEHDVFVNPDQVNMTLAVMPAHSSRTWLLLYNPTSTPVQFSQGTALWGLPTNFAVGPGQAWFWATAQLLQPCYTGAITMISLFPNSANAALYAWESF